MQLPNCKKRKHVSATFRFDEANNSQFATQEKQDGDQEGTF
ncbi:unnamed protein product [Phaeothamnion confervicola]